MGRSRPALITFLVWSGAPSGCAAQHGLPEPIPIPRCEGYRVMDGMVILFDDTVPGADPATFRCIENEYATDGRSVFFGARRMENIDAASFSVLPHGYSKDKRSVYYGYYTGRTIPDAEPETFQAIDLCFSKDRHAVHYWDIRTDTVVTIAADPATFRSSGYCYLDRYHLFNGFGQVLIGQDSLSQDVLLELCPGTMRDAPAVGSGKHP